MNEAQPLADLNEQVGTRTKVRPQAIRIRKDEFFTNARSTFPKHPLESLQRSIQQIGLLKPIVVERDPAVPNGFVLIAGERRHICITALVATDCLCHEAETGDQYEASVLYEFVDVKIVNPKDNIDRIAIMLAENGEHSAVPDYDYYQFAVFLANQKTATGDLMYDRQDLCRAFGKSTTWVTHTLQLSELPGRAMACLKDGRLCRSVAVHLLSALPEEVVNVLEYTESAILGQARLQIEAAERITKDAELEIECAEAEEVNAMSVGDRLAAKLQAKRAGDAKKVLRSAGEKRGRAEKVLLKPVFTDEAIKQTYADKPEMLKEGIAPKTRSAKLFREKLKDLETVLNAAGNSEYVVSEGSKKKYATDDLRVVAAAWEQLLGRKPLDIYVLLDQEYARRDAAILSSIKKPKGQ